MFIKYRRKITQMVRFFTRCLPIALAMFVHVSEREFFSPNSKL